MPSLNHFRENWKQNLGSTFEKLGGKGRRYFVVALAFVLDLVLK
jgi:hypothetical protein